MSQHVKTHKAEHAGARAEHAGAGAEHAGARAEPKKNEPPPAMPDMEADFLQLLRDLNIKNPESIAKYLCEPGDLNDVTHVASALGAVERTGTAPVDPNYEQLIRCSPEGFLPAVQILYQLVAPADSPLLLKPWTSSRRLPAPPPAVRPRPRVVRPPKPKPVKVTIDFAPLEERMRELRASVNEVVAEPSLNGIRAVRGQAQKLRIELAETAKKATKATAAEKTKLADMSSQVHKVIEALDRFQAAFEAVGKETLPRRVAAARRSLEAAGNLLLEEAQALLPRA